MSSQNIPIVDLGEWIAGGASRERFVATIGEALIDTGFFAVANHGVPEALTRTAYQVARELFHQPPAVKATYHEPGKHGQRGFTGFGKEHARDSQAPDLKEFWQVGRPDVADEHPVHRVFGPNIWPREVPEFRPAIEALYRSLDQIGGM
ncbi:MAG: 2-oxoglutarate and iron-dependent oxygenase domain-containing protein, partial [Deltaproteobacteria bacterium]|nr:2-oxoglutarate and iron-dependent oxygenase domain-containing protein [Deltaproteobacteria bacterium]